MGDSWEDDDFTPVVPQAVVLPTKTSWDDEDLPEDPNAGKTPEEIAAEAERRRKAEEARQARARKNAERAELRRQAEEEAERMAKETPEERALRERQAVEKADYAMADELFGAPGQPSSRPLSSLSLSSSTSSVGAGKAPSAPTVLKAPGDFTALAKSLGPQFKKAASSKDVTGFVSELLARGGKDPVGVEDLNELIKGLQALAVEKQRLADANRNKIGAKQKALAAKKKEHKAKSAQHKEVFGADFDEDDPDMDQYYAMEDEFM
ncbi:hypothetical protein NSK_001030 [Nannochloropsis salina CCMP1776]|uniref:Eukaryotic translation initiation factor 3 30 kDa subunit n=1 Tax=Nannochloropsis salina CCMP1776 TaxID=1027361 RepID=A0A4D9D8D6_9STRA|nr:hypothetical protein NSK_001030 [Nannochloropsis salina CCMP1776]|eukprot:TFJ87680.1 hypothetical protein NSK_001030 [Nannochloropsis salina CCMP1776]